MRHLGTEIWVELDERHLATYCTYVEVFVVGLRSTIATCIGSTKHNLLDWSVAHIGTRREDWAFEHWVLFATKTDEERNVLVLPLVLHITTIEVNILAKVATVTHNHITKTVVRILYPSREVGRHEEAVVHVETILTTYNSRNIIARTIGIEVLRSAEIRVTTNMLQRWIGSSIVAFVRRIIVPTEIASIDIVAQTFSNISLMLRAVEHITTTTSLCYMVIFESEFWIIRSFEIRTETECRTVELWDFRKTIVVVVICLTLTKHTKEEYPDFRVGSDEWAIEISIIVPSLTTNDLWVLRDIERITHWLFGNDIHHPTDSIRTIEGRTATTHHFDTVDHTSRYLFETIDRCKRRENRTAIHHELSVLTLETIDAKLWHTTILARHFDTHTSLEIKHIRHCVRCSRFYQKWRDNIDNSSSLTLFSFVFVGSNHHLVNEQRLFFESNIDFARHTFMEQKRCFDSSIAYHREDESGFARRKISKEKVSWCIRHRTDRGICQLDSYERKVLACSGIKHVTYKVSIWFLGVCKKRKRKE